MCECFSDMERGWVVLGREKVFGVMMGRGWVLISKEMRKSGNENDKE